MRFEITTCRVGDIGLWESCDAQSLAGAKACATKRFGAGYKDAELRVALINGDGQRQLVATKHNCPGSKWRSRL